MRRDGGRVGFAFDNQAVMATLSSTHVTQEMVNAMCQMRGYR